MGMSKNLMIAMFPEPEDEDEQDDFLELMQADDWSRITSPTDYAAAVPF